MNQQSFEAIEKVVKQEWAYLYASLVQWQNDFSLAEDVLQDALLAALENWPKNGIPESPAAWLLTTAKRKALDRLRRQANFDKKSDEQAILADAPDTMGSEETMHSISDSRLRLIFTCCHPALAESAQIALTLRTIGGLTTREIAAAFLIPEKTMQQRLVRAKNKISKAGIPFAIPDADLWQERLSAVLGVVYLIFNEGYNASHSETLVRRELSEEAIFLGRMLHELMPDSAETSGLLSLMLLHDARSNTRTSPSNTYITLKDQDRNLWDEKKIFEGKALLQTVLTRGQLGAYQIQAAISAVHTDAKTFDDTDWQQIWFLYNRLYALTPSPVVFLNAAVAQSYAQNVEAALHTLQSLEDDAEIHIYQPYHATLADLYSRAEQFTKASQHYHNAIELSKNKVERAFLAEQLRRLTQKLT